MGVYLVGCERSKTTNTCVAQLAGSYMYTCARLSSGEARCWGHSGFWGSYVEPEPVALRNYPRPISRLFVDRYALCASAEDGSLWCWEGDARPMVPLHLPRQHRDEPKKWPQEQPFTDVSHLTSAGRCVLTKDELLCWKDQNEPVRIIELPTKPIALAGGINFACVLLQNGQVFCRGYSVRGQLGILEGATEEERNNSRIHEYSRFTRVKTLGDDTRLIAAGLDHSCALKRDGSVWCWGRNDLGQIGKGDISICTPTGGLLLSCTPEEGLEPSRVDGLPADIIDLKLSHKTSCAIDGQGGVWCWGHVDEPTPKPVKLEVGAPVSTITIGERWCALLRDGRVRCQTDHRALSWSKARTMSLGCP